MTLQALREKIGDRAFFDGPAPLDAEQQDGNVSTPEFIALAERDLAPQPRPVLQHLALQAGEAASAGSDGSRAGPASARAGAESIRFGHRHARIPR